MRTVSTHLASASCSAFRSVARSRTAAVWRASAIRNLRFDEFFVEYSYLEDLEFSLQARKQGRFLLLPDAAFLHVPAPGGRKSRFWFGRIEVRNRHYIVRKHGLSLWRFWLGMTIRSVMTLGRGLARDPSELGRFAGNLREIAYACLCKIKGV